MVASNTVMICQGVEALPRFRRSPRNGGLFHLLVVFSFFLAQNIFLGAFIPAAVVADDFETDFKYLALQLLLLLLVPVPVRRCQYHFTVIVTYDTAVVPGTLLRLVLLHNGSFDACWRSGVRCRF